MSTQSVTASDLPLREARAGAASTWVSRIVMLGALSIVVGIFWDISWHRTIGRDTFWTPAHMAIYLGGLLGGLTAGALVIRTTFFATAEERAAAVGLWGFRGPIGAWVTIWGCFAMLTSAPFDNWWHDAYGLDVKILSPPHTVLAVGMWAVVLGALLIVLRDQNNGWSEGVEKARAERWFFIVGSGILLAMASVFLTETSFPNQQHSAPFFRASAMTYPLYLVGLARASKFRWSATMIALAYMLIVALMAWILPLFPGEPKLGPIANRVTNFVPLPFPLLMVVPAFALDLIRLGLGAGRSWWRDALIVVLSAVAFVALFSVTQWYFSKFLLSPNGQNWFFAADRHWGYTESVSDWRRQFWDSARTRVTPATFGVSLALALGSSAVGMLLGNWMSKVRR